MNEQFQELYKYLDSKFASIDDRFDLTDQRLAALNKKFKPIGKQLGFTRAKLKSIDKKLDSLIVHVDSKNDRQDESIESHETRIAVLESDCRILTS
jgi:chromosome segregation ATPase